MFDVHPMEQSDSGPPSYGQSPPHEQEPGEQASLFTLESGQGAGSSAALASVFGHWTEAAVPSREDMSSAHRLQSSGGVAAEQDEFPADGSVQDAKDFAKHHPTKGDNPSRWTKDQREAFNILAQDFGQKHQAAHTRWHQKHGPGGTQGTGSGMSFLRFHRQMLRDFKKTTGMSAPRGWDPNTPIPAEFKDPHPQGNPRDSNNPHVQLPGWLTRSGKGTGGGNRDFGKTTKLAGLKKVFKSLNDFQNPDQLGRALGESGYHASAHVNIGGDMASPETSPLDPSFLAWHGHIDRLIDRWLKTRNGRAWKKAHPKDPLIKAPSHGQGHGHMAQHDHDHTAPHDQAA